MKQSPVDNSVDKSGITLGTTKDDLLSPFYAQDVHKVIHRKKHPKALILNFNLEVIHRNCGL